MPSDNPINDLVNSIVQMTPEDLAKLDHSSLYMAREHATADQQNKLASPEHQAFTREVTADNPLMALPLAIATIGYQPYKMLTGQSRSSASMEQMRAGLTGVGQGLEQFGKDKAQAILGALKI